MLELSETTAPDYLRQNNRASNADLLIQSLSGGVANIVLKVFGTPGGHGRKNRQRSHAPPTRSKPANPTSVPPLRRMLCPQAAAGKIQNPGRMARRHRPRQGRTRLHDPPRQSPPKKLRPRRPLVRRSQLHPRHLLRPHRIGHLETSPHGWQNLHRRFHPRRHAPGHDALLHPQRPRRPNPLRQPQILCHPGAASDPYFRHTAARHPRHASPKSTLLRKKSSPPSTALHPRRLLPQKHFPRPG